MDSAHTRPGYVLKIEEDLLENIVALLCDVVVGAACVESQDTGVGNAKLSQRRGLIKFWFPVFGLSARACVSQGRGLGEWRGVSVGASGVVRGLLVFVALALLQASWGCGWGCSCVGGVFLFRMPLCVWGIARGFA